HSHHYAPQATRFSVSNWERLAPFIPTAQTPSTNCICITPSRVVIPSTFCSRQPDSPAAMPVIKKHLCLVALGHSRERLAADLVNAVARCGCNISDCRITPLGTHFAASLMHSGNWSAMAKMESALPGVAEDLGLAVQYEYGEPGVDAAEYRP